MYSSLCYIFFSYINSIYILYVVYMYILYIYNECNQVERANVELRILFLLINSSIIALKLKFCMTSK